VRAPLAIVAVVVALAALPSALAAGTRGGNAQIAGLQFALRAQGLYHGAIDAVSGPRTVAAVRAFQRIHGLPVTGLVNARMRKDLGPLGRPLFGARMLRRGNFGWDVAVLQFLLERQGIRVPISAYFDGPTLRGVRLLQRRHHLRPDGIVGAHTLTAIVGRTSVPLARSRTRSHTRRVARHVASKLRYRIHVVRAGDTLTALALHYGTTVSKLARLNHLVPSRYLLIGTRLRIPSTHRVATVRRAERTMSIAFVRALLDHWAVRYGVSRHLVRALAWMESGYNNALVSSAGARGVMQLLPSTFRYVETVLVHHRIRHTAEGNIHAGVALIHHLLQVFHGNRRLALAAWYQGERAVRTRGVYKVSRPFIRDVLALSHRM
jgi:LysM repeat protein